LYVLLTRRSLATAPVDAVRLFVRLSVCLSPKSVHNNAIFSKTKQFRAMVSYWRPTANRPTCAFQRTHYSTHNLELDESQMTNIWKFLPRDATHKRGLWCHAVSVRPSVCHVCVFCRNE